MASSRRAQLKGCFSSMEGGLMGVEEVENEPTVDLRGPKLLRVEVELKNKTM